MTAAISLGPGVVIGYGGGCWKLTVVIVVMIVVVVVALHPSQ